MVTGPGAVTDLGLEIGLGAVTGPVREVVQAPDLVVDRDLAQEQDQAQGQVQAPDQARDKGQAQWIDRGHHLVQDRVRAGKVPLVANGIVEDLHRGTVNVVRPVVLANLDQEAHQAEVVVDAVVPVVAVVDAVAVVAEVVVDVDVDPK